MKYCTVCKAKYEDSVSFCPVDGEVLEDDPSSIVDTVLDGQYQIESMLGKGGMGAVYRARHILLGDRVAIKILPPEVRNNAEWLRRFRREGQAARRFRHPNAVTVYDLRTAADGTIYMVMEYVEGHTLDAEIKRRGNFTPAEAVQVLDPIMSVLNTAHAMGVVHRDLKPENIMIGTGANDSGGSVKLLDLGIAKMREIAGSDTGGTTALTMAGQVLGTPYYMSPEQWGEIPRDGNPEIDGRADIYSLGLVFYEMIAGWRPCTGKTLSELRRQHVSVVPQPLHEAVPSVSPAFSQAIARATAKDRNDRPSTAGELAAELRAAVGNGNTAWSGRTMPDLPHVQSSSSHTSEIATPSNTKSDLDAPTIMTLDADTSGPDTATPTIPPRVEPSVARPMPAAPPAGQPSNSLNVSAPTILSSPDMASSLTAQQPAKEPPKMPTAPRMDEPVAKKKGSMVFVGIGALVLVLLVVGVGGFFAYKWMNSKPSTATSAESNTGKTNSSGAEASKELGNYWLELLPDKDGDQPVRVAGLVPIKSGQKLRFHFRFDENGFAYIIGPGDENRPTIFLSNKPLPASGLTSNQVRAGNDLSFPGGDNSITLDNKPGTETYTIVFSPSPLSSPAFFATPVTFKPLTDAEQKELTSFLAAHKSTDVTTELNDQDKTSPFVRVKVPTAGSTGNPIAFDVRIEHK